MDDNAVIGNFAWIQSRIATSQPDPFDHWSELVHAASLFQHVSRVWVGISQSEKKTPVSGAPSRTSRVRRHDAQFHGRPNVPAPLAVARDGKLVYARGFGYADEPMTLGVQPTSRFRIASISKPITAAMILRPIEMGLLKLSDNPFDVFKIPLPADADPRLRKITIEHLLHHTAGWDRAVSFDPMFRPLIIAKAEKVDAPAKPMDIIHYMVKRKLDFNPGERYAYSNFGYCILGRVIDKLPKQSYDAAVQKHLFDPLAIKETQLGHTLTCQSTLLRNEKGRPSSGRTSANR